MAHGTVSPGNWHDGLAHELRERFQTEIYGRIPFLSAPEIVAKQRVCAPALGNGVSVERWILELDLGGRAARLGMLVVMPEGAAPRGVILAQMLQRDDDHLARIERAFANGERSAGARDLVLELVLGRHIHVPPAANVAAQGFALALFCPAEIVPDHAERAAPILDRLSPTTGGDRSGALACWAALVSSLRVALSEDVRLGQAPIVALGHSRHGKAALLAAAFDQSLAGVVAHQSGRFGASMSQRGVGETAAHIVRTYPHWFCPRFVNHIRERKAPTIDQNHLLALIAPRPILLGNGLGDFWADPAGAFRAARAASAAFAHFGAPGLMQPSPRRPNLAGGIVFFARRGGHGVTAADWRHFLAFLYAKFDASVRGDGK